MAEAVTCESREVAFLSNSHLTGIDFKNDDVPVEGGPLSPRCQAPPLCHGSPWTASKAQ